MSKLEIGLVIAIILTAACLLTWAVLETNKRSVLWDKADAICDYRKTVSVQTLNGMKSAVCAEPDGGVSSYPIEVAK